MTIINISINFTFIIQVTGAYSCYSLHFLLVIVCDLKLFIEFLNSAMEGRLAKNVTTLEHLPYTPDLAPDDFYLFPQSEGTVLM